MERSRDIFRYWNGQKEVCADPMVLEERWFKAIESVDINFILDQFYGPDFIRQFNDDGKPIDESGNIIEVSDEDINTALKFRNSALGQLAPIIHQVFGTHPLDDEGNGMTTAEALDAFTAWNVFRSEVKKNTEENAKTSSSTGTASGGETRPTAGNSSTRSTSTASVP